jgi:hypothetical protein
MPCTVRSDMTGMLYLVLLLVPFILLRSHRLGLAVLLVTIVLLYRSRVKTATRRARKRVNRDEDRYQPGKQWKDPWGTRKS